jgi:hypothetical protein
MGKTELKKLQDSYGYEVGSRAIRGGARGRRRSKPTSEPEPVADDAAPVADAAEESDMDLVEDSPVDVAEVAEPVETPAKKKKKKPSPYTACGPFSRKPNWSKKKKASRPPRDSKW